MHIIIHTHTYTRTHGTTTTVSLRPCAPRVNKGSRWVGADCGTVAVIVGLKLSLDFEPS